jgi:hypothetical protein
MNISAVLLAGGESMRHRLAVVHPTETPATKKLLCMLGRKPCNAGKKTVTLNDGVVS